MLSRIQFELACKAFSCRHPDWLWKDFHRPGYGFLSRSTSHVSKVPVAERSHDDHDEDLEEDSATAKPATPVLNMEEYIVYSASFNTPAFYFTAHDSRGIALDLRDILHSSFFKLKPPTNPELTDFSIIFPSVQFPLLSQGDHPSLGINCWYFHPCSSETAVSEFLCEVEQRDWDEEAKLVRWLELWLMIVGSVLNI